jgi:predicted dehydrogenase
MTRRDFHFLAASAAAAAPKQIKTALLTHADGPHLSAYLPALAATQEAGSVVLADASGTVESAARKALGAKLGAVYRDPAGLLRKEKPEFALVTMAADVAPPVVRAALESGCHVLAEKPACVRASDFDALADLAKKKNRLLVLALANRIDPLVVESRRLMKSGLVGKVFGVEIHIVADQTRLTRPAYHQQWFAKKERAGGGHLIWLGIHWLDLAMYLTGSRIRDVAGFTANVGGQPMNVEDSATAALRFDNGSLGTVTSGYYVDKGYHSQIKIWGSDGWLELRKHGSPVPLEWYSNKEGKVRRYEGPLEPSGYEPFVRHIVRAAAGLEQPVLDAEDCRHVLHAVFATYRAAETGQAQKVS